MKKPAGWPYRSFLETAEAEDGRAGRDALIAALQQRSREAYFNALGEGLSLRVGDVLDWMLGIESPGGRYVDEAIEALIRSRRQ